MTYSARQLWDMLDGGYGLPYGATQVAVADQVLRHVDSASDEELSFATRMFATHAYLYGGEPSRAFVTFSWCVSEYDRTPERYEQHSHSLHWYFKNIVSALTRFPEIPLDRTRAVLDDMARRYRQLGHSPHAVYAHRHYVARHVGDLESAEQWYQKWCTTPRDHLSDCVGCDPTGKAGWLTMHGRDEEAIALAEPVLAGRLTCSEQPQAILVTLMLPYLRTGRLELARDAFRKGYRLHSRRLADLGDIGEYLYFCALTGNAPRGLEILQRHVDWLDRAPSPSAAMDFSAGAAMVLRQLVDMGHGDLTVRRHAHQDRPAGPIAVSDLAAELLALTRSIAARFDLRNGSAYQSARIEERLATVPVVDYLALRVAGVRLASGMPVATEPMAPATLTVDEWVVPPTREADELLDLADAQGRLGYQERSVACLTAFDERYGGGELTTRQRARRAEAHAATIDAGDHAAEAALAMQAAIELYDEAGDDLGAHIARSRYGFLMVTTGRSGEGVDVVRAATTWLIRHAPAERHCAAHCRLGIVLMLTGAMAEAHDEFEYATAALVANTEPTTALYLAIRRAEWGLRAGEADEAVRYSAEAVERMGGSGPAQRGPIWSMRAAALLSNDDVDEAVAVYDRALADLPQPEWQRQLTLARARALATTDRAAEAVEVLVEAVAQAVAGGSELAATEHQLKLAAAYLHSGRPMDAAEVAEQALATVLAHVAEVIPAGLLELRRVLAKAYQELGQRDETLAQLDEAVRLLKQHEDRYGAGRQLEELGRLLDDWDRDVEAAVRFEQAAEEFSAIGADWAALVCRRRQAMSLHWAGQTAQAVERLADADRLATMLDPRQASHEFELAMLDFDVARVWDQAGDASLAQRRAEAAADRFRKIGAGLQAARSERLNAYILRGLGQTERGIEALWRALTDVPGDHPLQTQLREDLDEFRAESR